MPSESTQQHREAAREQVDQVSVAVLTISDSRSPETDKSGTLIREMLEEADYRVCHYSVLKDEPEDIRNRVLRLCSNEEVDVILTNGGTGVAPRDGTVEAIDSILDRYIPGFGEIFRMLSWQEIGAATMLSRATAGMHGQTLIFAMPGSSNAVRLAMEKLIVPELKHLVLEVRGGR